MKKKSFLTILILIIGLLAIFMFWIVEQSNRNADAVLERTAYIDGINIKGVD